MAEIFSTLIVLFPFCYYHQIKKSFSSLEYISVRVRGEDAGVTQVAGENPLLIFTKRQVQDQAISSQGRQQAQVFR